MKLIPKKQQGGPFASLFANFNVVAPPQQQQQQSAGGKSSSRNEDDDNSISKRIKSIKELIGDLDGLPVDIDVIQSQTSNIFYMASMMGSNDVGTSFDPELIQSMSLIKKANFYKKEYDEAYANAVSKGALNEIAIGNDGTVYVYDKDKELKVISIQEYLNNKENYHILTNSNLLRLRAFDQQFAFSDIFDTINNGTSMQEINKEIKACITSLGSTDQTINGYTKRQADKIQVGLEVLQQVAQKGNAVVDGIYKTKAVTKSEKEQANAAISYIYSMLSNNSKLLLAYKSGDPKHPEKGAYNIISQYVMSMMKNTFEYEETYQNDFNPDGTIKDKTTSSSSSKFPEENAAFSYMNGRGYSEIINILPNGNIGGQVYTTTMPLSGNDDKPFKGKYLSEIRDSGFSGILDLKNATMGMRRIIADKEVELTDNKAHLVYWPTLEDGVTPDLRPNTIEMMEKANKKIEELGVSPNSEEAAKIYQEAGLRDTRRIRSFTVLDGKTNSKAIGMDDFDSTTLLETVSDEEFNAYKRTYQNYWSDGSKKEKLDIGTGFFGLWADNVYKGTIWIPNMFNYRNAMVGTGDKINSNVAQQYDQMQYNSDRDFESRMNNYNNPQQYDD